MKKILVANRGEIALRIMKTIKKMGLKSVAVYSDADRDAMHVKYANEAIYLGPAPSNQSYLLGDKIIEEALKINVDGIHPGYGFLSENADFARKVNEAGICFIGPEPHAIEVMGSKLAAKQAVKEFNIPMVPGTDQPITDVQKAMELSLEIGYPILIKASAGGGGKGMRIVESKEEFFDQMERAVSEAKSSFGDGAVFIEKFVEKPRHIEIQILADKHQNIVYLFERDCSIQRRHQKVIEEAPSAVLSPELRKQMGEAAVQVAKACNYVGAGTVEFLLDKDMKFYFLEMNTRLQVEHPVSEIICNKDLVEEQIKVAKGEKLDFTQEDLSINGHAIELRIYAEDPENNFLPSIGVLEEYKEPIMEGVRVDGSFIEGMEIPIYYDPMIAKLIVHAPTRQEAIQKMKEAISNYTISGIKNTLNFGRWTCDQEQFINGSHTTNFIKENFTSNSIQEFYKNEALIAAKVALKNYLTEKNILKVNS